MCMWVNLHEFMKQHMHAGSCGEWKMADLQAVVSCHVGLGTELWSFTRAAWALTCGAFPPAPVPFT